jgi:hypothetical protein
MWSINVDHSFEKGVTDRLVDREPFLRIDHQQRLQEMDGALPSFSAELTLQHSIRLSRVTKGLIRKPLVSFEDLLLGRSEIS